MNLRHWIKNKCVTCHRHRPPYFTIAVGAGPILPPSIAIQNPKPPPADWGGGDSHSFATINFDWRLLLGGKQVGAMAFPLATVGDQATSCLNAWWKEGGVGIGNPCNNFREIWRTENIRGARHKNEQQSIQHNIGGKDTINNKIMQKLGRNRTMHKNLK